MTFQLPGEFGIWWLDKTGIESAGWRDEWWVIGFTRWGVERGTAKFGLVSGGGALRVFPNKNSSGAFRQFA